MKTAWEYAQKQATVVANSIQRLHWVIIMFSIRFLDGLDYISHVHVVDYITLKVVKLLAKAKDWIFIRKKTTIPIFSRGSSFGHN